MGGTRLAASRREGVLSTPQHRRAARTSSAFAFACAAGSGVAECRPYRLRRLEEDLAEGLAPVLQGEASVSGAYLGELRLRDASGPPRIEVNGPDSMPLKVSMAALELASPLLDKLRFEQAQMDGESRTTI